MAGLEEIMGMLTAAAATPPSTTALAQAAQRTAARSMVGIAASGQRPPRLQALTSRNQVKIIGIRSAATARVLQRLLQLELVAARRQLTAEAARLLGKP